MIDKSEVLDKLSLIRDVYEQTEKYDVNDFYLLSDLLGEQDLSGFFSPMPNMYIKGIKNIFLLDHFNELIVRDGAFGLFDFFNKNNSPEGLKTILYIHHSLSYIVPLEWKNNVKFYGLYFNQSEKKKNKLIITGPIYKGINNLSYFQSQLVKFLESEDIKHIDVNLSLPVSIGGLSQERLPGIEDFLNIIERCRSKSMTLRYCPSVDLANDNYENHYVMPIDANNTLSATSVFEQQLYVNGAIPFNCKKIDRSGLNLESFSLRHGMLVFKDSHDLIIGTGEEKLLNIKKSVGLATKSFTEIEMVNIVQDLNGFISHEFLI